MWVSLLSALLQLSNVVLAYMQQRQLIEAGKAEQLAENLNASIDLLGKMDKARNDAVAKHNARNGVPDKDDPYRRD